MALKNLFSCWGGKVFFSRIVKPGTFRLDITPKENFLSYSTQFDFFKIRIVPGNLITIAIDMCGKNPITEEWIYEIT